MATQQIDIAKLLNFQPKQWEAYWETFRVKYLLYGGAAGGGKSYLLRWAPVGRLLDWAVRFPKLRGIKCMIACEDYVTLKDRQLDSIESEFPSWLGDYHKSDREYVLKPHYGGGRLCFRNLEDPQKYASSQWAYVGIDEALLNDEMVFKKLRARLRWVQKDPNTGEVNALPTDECIMLLGSNPVGKGIGWGKRRFIDRVYDDINDNPKAYGFVQSFVSDNKYLDAQYAKDLDMLDEDERKALKEGSWDSFTGQYFKMWRREAHVCEPFDIPRQWLRYSGMDWGVTDPAAQIWAARSPYGHLFVYKELYEAGISAQHWADLVRGMAQPGERVVKSMADTNIFIKEGTSGNTRVEQLSIGDQLAKAGLRYMPASKSRKPGWAIMKEWMTVYDDYPMDFLTGVKDTSKPMVPSSRIHWFSSCYESIRTIPNQVYDKNDKEDMETKGVEDHLPDGHRYMLVSLPPPPKIGSETMRESAKEPENTSIFTDPVQRAIEGLAPLAKTADEDYSTGW